MPDFAEIDVPFVTGTNVRDLLNLPHLSAVEKESMSAIVVAPKRLADIMPFLHKPATKPAPIGQLPAASIFRGMIFGHIAVYTSKSVEEITGKVFYVLTQAPTVSAPGADAKEKPQAPKSPVPQDRMKIQMVGMPSKAAARESQQTQPRTSAGQSDFFSTDIPPRKDAAPSEEKLNRWTELIPSGTRIRKPKYQPEAATVYFGPGEIPLPGHEDDPQHEDPAPAPKNAKQAPAPLPQPAQEPPRPATRAAAHEAEQVLLPVNGQPSELAAPERVRLAKEADRLIYLIIGALEGVVEMRHEEATDLVTEMRMLQLELDKFKPGIVRITDMIMNVSKIEQTQEHVARLKECLRGLGLLL